MQGVSHVEYWAMTSAFAAASEEVKLERERHVPRVYRQYYGAPNMRWMGGWRRSCGWSSVDLLFRRP